MYDILVQIQMKGNAPAWEPDMQLAEIVYRKVKSLAEPEQKEVLDFVEYLEEKLRRDDRAWSLHSLAAATAGLESDNWPEFKPEDLKEHWG
jgi:hypothetical protein